MSRGVKLALMGVAGAALLYSCTPGIGGGGFPFWLMFLPNMFRGGPAVTTPATPPGQTATTPNSTRTAPATTQSQRGGFGSTGSTGSTGSS